MSGERITGLDLARAISILGMMIVNYKLAMGAEGSGPPWLSWFAGLFEGRAAAVFVVLAGIGFTIMTRKARSGNKEQLREMRVRVWKRSVYLLILGFLLILFGWNADILHYYALFLFLASFLIRASNKILLGTAITIWVSAQWCLFHYNYSAGWDSSFHTYLDFWTVNGFMRNTWFNGFHPAIPWFCFFLVGMWFSRLNMTDFTIRKKWLLISLFSWIGSELLSAAALKVGSTFFGTEIAVYLFQTKPMPPNLFYMFSATSSAILVILLCLYLAESKHARGVINALIQTGQMALTHYVTHVVVGLGTLKLFGYLENGSLIFSTLYAVAYFVALIMFSLAWKIKFKAGPLELILRKF
ncbi:DUF418 domain-containing protein [Paenibacillus sp. SYP-B3998]|uniref:DUF418 domain-containing protein n=1 Tax=Paenibacillus sp. SYP-B3998 TaxID=2678564 RepID=A0A6G3ZY88_9BACL|nr:DUF418 domain-containing protein [Paenibacillus sp. SYP-B3998]NEW06541.1 DUF418 domain-containing protein [Paenibacillus sp. SYP-B3998]